ncbi:hypothetical protein QJQ45_019314 [Haematococcus lacustris]|nr:hypothetical protein QJQ45_019314 [Haematococcus lacustris]
MAKSIRSNSKKQLRTWRREHLVANWQAQADARRYESLAAKAAEQRPARPEPVAPEAAAEAPAEEPVEQKQRGRTRPPKTRQDILPTPLPSAVEMDVEDVPAGMKKKKKGINVGRVQKKKKRAGKAFMAGNKNQFHKLAKKGGKKPIH